jgi:hypothetical protein
MNGVHRISTADGDATNVRDRLSRNDPETVFQRVAERRGHELSTLEMPVIQAIFQDISQMSGEKSLTTDFSTVQVAGKKAELFLLKQYETICDSGTPCQAKRRAHDLISEMLRLIDENAKDKNNIQTEEIRRKKRRLSAGRVSMQTKAAVESTGSASQVAVAEAQNVSNPLINGRSSASLAPTNGNKEQTQAATNSTASNRPQSSSFQQQPTTISASTTQNENTSSAARGVASQATSGTSSSNQPMSKAPQTVAGQPNTSSSGSSAKPAPSTHTSTNGNKQSGSSTNKTKPRSIASLSAASATTSAIAHDSTTPAVRPPTARATTPNAAGAQSGSHATNPPPAYQKRTSNALAQQEIQLRQQRKEKPGHIITTTTESNGNGTQSTSSLPTGDSNGRTSSSTVQSNRTLTATKSVEPRRPYEPSAPGPMPMTSGTHGNGSESTSASLSNGTSVVASQKKSNNTLVPVKTSDCSAEGDAMEVSAVQEVLQSPVSVVIPICPHDGNHDNSLDVSSDDVDDDSGIPESSLTVFNNSLKITFPPDTTPNTFAAFADSRPGVVVGFSNYRLSYPQMDRVSKRFARWEPFWEVKKVLMTGVTSPVDSKELLVGKSASKLTTPNTVGSYHSSFLWSAVKDCITTSPDIAKIPKDGEYRVLIRMLPLNPSEKLKKKRADCHLWPLGTYLQIYRNGENRKYPQALVQRKQQGYDHSVWKGLCEPFDLTSFVRDHCKSSAHIAFELCCHEKEPYIFSLSLCRFRTPQSLFRDLKPKLKRLSLNASFEKIKGMMKNNTVSLDSDDEKAEGGEREPRRCLFSLQDASAKTAIVTPVRGRKCLHFSVSLNFRVIAVIRRGRGFSYGIPPFFRFLLF